MKPAIKAGVYHPTQIQHLAITRLGGEQLAYMVTLRDNQQPLESHVGQSDTCLYVDEKGLAVIHTEVGENEYPIVAFKRAFDQHCAPFQRDGLPPLVPDIMINQGYHEIIWDQQGTVFTKSPTHGVSACTSLGEHFSGILGLYDTHNPQELIEFVAVMTGITSTWLRNDQRFEIIATDRYGQEVFIELGREKAYLMIEAPGKDRRCYVLHVKSFLRGISPDYVTASCARIDASPEEKVCNTFTKHSVAWKHISHPPKKDTPVFKKGYYHLGQIRKLVTCVNSLGEWVFLVTLRDNQTPAFPGEGDGLGGAPSDNWFFVNEDGHAPLNYMINARQDCDKFVAEFEANFLSEEERGPAFKIPVELVSPVTAEAWEVLKGPGYTPDKIGTVFQDHPLPHGGMSVEEVSEIMAVYLTSSLARFTGDPYREVFGMAGPYCGEAVTRHAAEIVVDLNEIHIFVPDHVGFGAMYVGQIKDALEYLNWPRHIPFDDMHQRIINSIPRNKKIRNSGISGALIRRGVGGHGLVVETGHQGPLSIHPSDILPPGSGFHPSDKDIHGANGELLARGIPGSGAGFPFMYSDIPPVNVSYLNTPKREINPIKGPTPPAFDIPWAVGVKVFRMQIIAGLIRWKFMSPAKAMEYVDLWSETEDGDKLIREMVARIGEDPSPW